MEMPHAGLINRYYIPTPMHLKLHLSAQHINEGRPCQSSCYLVAKDDGEVTRCLCRVSDARDINVVLHHSHLFQDLQIGGNGNLLAIYKCADSSEQRLYQQLLLSGETPLVHGHHIHETGYIFSQITEILLKLLLDHPGSRSIPGSQEDGHRSRGINFNPETRKDGQLLSASGHELVKVAPYHALQAVVLGAHDLDPDALVHLLQ